MKTVLIASYYFPPSGGSGVQRTLKFVRYLPGLGWKPIVLTVRPDKASFPSLDPDLADEIPNGIRVVQTRTIEPYGIYARLTRSGRQSATGTAFVGANSDSWRTKLGMWMRANILLPDGRAGWVPFASRAGKQIIEEEPVSAVLTTGPPHSTHFIGRRLAKQEIPWVADLRDPWTDISYNEELPRTRMARRLDAHLESKILQRANRVVVVSPGMKQLLANRTDAPIDVITNGYDPADFESVDVEPARRFTISFVGNMPESQNPVALWQVLKELQREERSFVVRTVGNIHINVVASIREHGLADSWQHVPYVPHREAVREMCSATMLLLCINRVRLAAPIVTGKLFEYLASGRPVLGIGDPEGDTSVILQETGGGCLFHWDDRSGVESYVRQALDAFESGRGVTGASPDNITSYSRRTQAATLASILDEISS